MPALRQYAAGLTQKGYNVELFDGGSVPRQALQDFNDLSAQLGRKLTPSEVLKTDLYKADRAWTQNLVDQGYTVIDVGDPLNLGFSSFYSGEKQILFGGK